MQKKIKVPEPVESFTGKMSQVVIQKMAASKEGGATFMTQVGLSPNKGSKKTIASIVINKDLDATSKKVSKTSYQASKADQSSIKGDSILQLPDSPKSDHEIQLSEPYEDDDYKIYFDKVSLLNHITFMEDDNLFKIHLVQEDEQNVEKAQKKMEKSTKEMLLQIEEGQKNIDALNQSKEVVLSKH